ncbi:MAG: nitroreductase family protein [Actinomycetota bacterium]
MTTNDAGFDLDQIDRLLTTTRSVRKRLDFERPVEDQVLFDCIDLAEQAPSGGNDASRRWIVVRDEATKQRLGEIYARNGEFMTRVSERLEGTGHGKEKVFNSSAYLVENFAKAPVLVIAAIWGIHDDSGRPGLFDSVIQSAWSFNLALRSRGLGSTWTTLLNASVDELAGILAIPDGVTTIVTFPVAYTKGSEFRPAPRRPAEQITYFDRWGFTRARASEDGGTSFNDGQGVVAEVDIEASPRTVWPFVSDIGFPVGVSDETQGAEWDSDERGLGATFTGHNKLGDMEWSLQNHVTAYEEGRVFEWSTVDPASPGGRWRFEIMDQGVGIRLRFSMEIGTENNLLVGIAADSDNPAAVINGRRKQLRANMQRTCDAIKAAVEAAS